MVSFNHANYPSEDLPLEEITGLVVRVEGGEWVELPILNRSENFREPVNSGDIFVPAEFNGKNVQFAFKYLWDGAGNACMWFINDFKVVATKDVPTAIENIHSTVISDNRIYDLQGRLVKNPSHGIYIINGKKVVIR